MEKNKKINFFVFLFFIGFSNSSLSSSENDFAFVYSEAFTEVFDFAAEKAVSLPQGVNALRAYKSRYPQGDVFSLQIYLDKKIKINFKKDEETLVVYDNALNGFLHFSEKALFIDESIKEVFFENQAKQSDSYGALVMTYSRHLIMTGGITRYTKKLIPSYTLVEVMLPGPDVEAVYLYTGDTPLTEYAEIMDLTNKLAETGDLSAEGYLKIPLPEEIKTFYMKNCDDLCPP